MIQSCHLLVGAAIASEVQPAPLALLLALLSHFVLDFIPHWDQPLPQKNHKKIRSSNFLRGFSDIFIGSLLVFVLAKGQLIIIVGAIVALLPDIISFFNMLFPQKILKGYDNFHLKKVHFLKNKKIPLFWKIFNQVLISGLAIFFLLT